MAYQVQQLARWVILLVNFSNRSRIVFKCYTWGQKVDYVAEKTWHGIHVTSSVDGSLQNTPYLQTITCLFVSFLLIRSAPSDHVGRWRRDGGVLSIRSRHGKMEATTTSGGCSHTPTSDKQQMASIRRAARSLSPLYGECFCALICVAMAFCLLSMEFKWNLHCMKRRWAGPKKLGGSSHKN